MTKKKKEIIDELELLTPEVEERIVKESWKFLIEREEKFYKDTFSTPAKILRGDLREVSVFISNLIEKLDLGFFDANKILSCEDEDSAWLYKDIQIKYVGDDGVKQVLLNQLLLFIDSLDFTRVRLLENELTESKKLFKEWAEKEKKKERTILEYKGD